MRNLNRPDSISRLPDVSTPFGRSTVTSCTTVTGTIADEAYAEARYGDAVVAWFRALAREAADRTLLGPSAGLTAHEVALRLAPLFPDHAAALARSGDVFDVVLYGKLQVGRAEAEEVRDLDAALRSARPRSLPDLVGVAS